MTSTVTYAGLYAQLDFEIFESCAAKVINATVWPKEQIKQKSINPCAIQSRRAGSLLRMISKLIFCGINFCLMKSVQTYKDFL